MHILRCLHTSITWETDPNRIFVNSSEKLLVYKLLLLPTEPFFHVVLSTMGHRYTAWCGIYDEKKNIWGVADIVAWNKKATLFGKVKGVSGSQTEAVARL